MSGLDVWGFTGAVDQPTARTEEPGWSHERGDGTVAFRSRDLELTFDAVTGRRRPVAAAGAPDLETLDLPGRREVRWVHDRFGRPKDVVIIDRDGGTRFGVPGMPWLAPVRDGSAALDVGTGLGLWDHDAARGAGAWEVLTDGRLVLVPTDDGEGGVVLAARRLQTGEEAWRVALPGEVLAIDEVDGRTLLVLTEEELVALR